MTDTIKILGQSAPNATTETALYTVPAATSAIISTLSVCNRAATPATFRLSFDQGGGGTSTKDYVYYDLEITGNDSFLVTAGFSLAATDVVNVYASSSSLSFNLFGIERT